MAVFKATKNRKKVDEQNVFKATENKSTDISVVRKIESSISEDSSKINEYITRRKDGKYISSDEVNSYREAANRYKSNRSKYNSLLKSTGGAYDANAEGEHSNWLSGVLSDMDSSYDFYSQFKTEDEYNAWDVENTRLKNYGGKSYSELNDIIYITPEGEEKEWLKKYANASMKPEDYDAEIHAIDNEISGLEAVLSQYDEHQYTRSGEYTQAWYRDFANKYGTKEDVESKIDELRASKWDWENKKKYGLLPENEDFVENSGYVSTKFDEGFSWDKLLNNEYGMGYADLAYEYINNPNIRGEIETQDAIYSHDGPSLSWLAGEESSYADKGYDRLKEDEIAIYNYLYQTEGADAAQKYLDYMEHELTNRDMEAYQQEITELADKFPVLTSIASVPENLKSGIGFIDVAYQNLENSISEGITGEYAAPINYNTSSMKSSVASSTIRGTVAQNIADKTGVIDIKEEDHPVLAKIFNGKSLGDVYQLGMSMADSAAVALMSPVVGTAGTALLGGSAATQGVLNAVANGATDEQAIWMGVLNGGFEMLFEKYELEHLLGADTNMVKAIFNQAFTEGIGEGATTIANTLADVFVLAENSDWQKSINEYIANGYSPEDAKKQAFWDAAIQVGWDTVGGMLSGGIMGAGGSIANNIVINQDAVKLYGDSQNELVAQGLESAEGSLSNKLAQKYQKKLDNGKKLTGGQLNRLVNANEQQFIAEDIASITEAAASRLAELGESGDVNTIASALAKQTAGQELTRAEKKAISDSKYGQRVANELNTDNIKSGEYTSAWAERLDTNRINPDEYSRLVNEAESAQESEKITPEATIPPTQETAQEAPTEPVETPATEVQAENVEEIQQPDVVSAESAEPESTVTLEEASKKYGAQAQAMVHTYTAGQDVAKYDSAYQQAYNMGQSGVSLSYAMNSESTYYLTEKQRELAYEAGAAASDKVAQELDAKNKAAANGKTGRKRGVVKGEGVTIKDLKETFNDTQNKAYKILSTYAEATGIDIVLYRSEANAEGKFEGAQGKYKHSDPGTIYIDINAGLAKIKSVDDLAKYTMLRTFAHEFTHFIEKWNPVQYNEFRRVVFDTLTERGENVEDLIDEKQAATPGLTYDKASREVVAEAMTDILPDANFVEKLATKHKTIFEKLLEKLKEFVAELKEYFNSLGHNRSREANALKEQVGDAVHYVESIVDMFDRVAVEAVENYQATAATEEVVETVVEETKTKSETKVEESKTKTEPKTTSSEHGFTITDNVERGSLEITFDEKPSDAVRDVLKENKFRWHGKKKVWYGFAEREAITDALNAAYEAETVGETVGETEIVNETTETFDNTTETSVIKSENKPSDFETAFWNATQGERDEVVDAINENTKISHIKPTEIYNDNSTSIVEEVNNNGTENVDNGPAVLEPDSDGEGASRLLDESQVKDVQGTSSERDTSADASERGAEASRNDDRSDTADRAGRSERDSEVGDLRRDDELTAGLEAAQEYASSKGYRIALNDLAAQKHIVQVDIYDKNDLAYRLSPVIIEEASDWNKVREEIDSYEKYLEERAKKLEKTVSEQVEQKSTENPKGNNFVIGDSLNLPHGDRARFRANVDAIRLIKQLATEDRSATAAEQEILSKYVGWGGLANAFGEMRYNRETHRSEMTAKNGWESEFEELKGLVDEGVITEQEYKDMSASTKNAHYTSVEVIRAMYDGLKQLGFKGGRMLEPSSGVGNFVGAMPTDMSAKVNSWTMVELDRITGQIAKYLYPNSDVRIQGFETANIPDNYMDVAIGNVPFGNFGVVDRTYPKRVTKSIHNYFFAKSIDKVRPGGVVMFITSSFTMDSKESGIRQYIMERADLLGAIRLPNTSFKDNAGTEVVTDILILKKRKAGTEYSGEDFLDADYDYKFGSYVSNYFKAHPEMILGTPVTKKGMYGANTLTYEPLKDHGTIGDQIREAFKNVKGEMIYTAKLSPEKTNFAVERATKKTKQGGFVVNSDGSISRNENGQLVKFDTDEKTAKRISGMLGIRDAYRTLANYLQQGQDTKIVKQARKALNTAYDAFVKEYGYINSPANKKAIDTDPDSYSILSLENFDAKKKTAKKADIFTKDTISANKTVTHVDSVSEGVIASLNLTGGVDTELIAKLTSRTVEDVTSEIIASRLAFKTRNGTLIARESYLAGNVRAKLREAESLVPYDKDYEHNIEELRRVIPKDIPYNEIYVTPGAAFIPNEVYADFIAHMLGGRNNPNSYSGPDVEVGRTISGEFKITLNNKRLKASYYNTQTWGTARKSFLELIDAMMASRTVKVNDTIEGPDGRKISVLNEAETEAANEKVKAIQKEFEEWLWKDESRRTELAKLYNETFNAIVNPKYDGSNLTVNGINADFTLREHQANAVHRIISSGGNTLLAHRVGAGKTLEMAAAAMKLRELGVVKKPVFVVPKSLVAQWGVEFHSYFPASRILVADDKSFTPANRKIFTNKIANGDYDAVIVSYEQFEKIPMSVEYQTKFYEEQIDEIINAIAEEKAESRDGKGLTVKEMEKKKAQLEKKLKELTSKPKDEDNIDFEMLGIDSLFVDEAHNFKNLEYVSKMTNVAGLGSAKGSQRAFDLYTKIRYLQSLNGGRGIVFATATPVMNSMVELYIMQRYLQPDILEQLGLRSFDAWAKQFGEVVNKWEINPSGTGMRQKQVFANFRNLNELQLLFHSFADVLTEVPGLKIPKMKGGAVKIVECEPGQFQKDYMLQLQKRAEVVKSVDPSIDNMLKITSDGRKVSYTQRMIDPSLPYEAGCKLYRCCENVLTEYKENSDIKGTQIIFCDMATPKGSDKSKAENTTDNVDDTFEEENAKLYDDMRAYLVKKGIPAKEIAFIHEADSDAKRKQLFADVNDGKVRILIGSTGKMGVGMNAQKRIVAIHHLDAPWRPGDVEQRDGRAFRQKNMNEEVSKYVYVTKGSFDSRLWDILDRKQHFIGQIMNGEDVGRTAEDTGEVTLSAAEVKALASGNPLIEEQTKLTDAIKKLENLQKAYNSSIRLARTKLSDDEQKIAYYNTRITNIREDIKSRVDTYSEGKFSMNVGGQIYTDKKDAGIALAAEITAKVGQGSYVTVGTFAGFELKVLREAAEYKGLIQGKANYKFNVYLGNTTRMVNHIGEIIAGFENQITNAEQLLSETNADLKAQQEIIAKPFEKAEELAEKRARFNEVMELLAPKNEQQLGNESDDVQYQSRDYLDEDEPKRYNRSRRVPSVNEYATLVMQWAYSDRALVGEQKFFYKKGNWVLVEKVEDGYIELKVCTNKQRRFFEEDIKNRNEELHSRRTDDRILGRIVRYEDLSSSYIWDSANDVGRQTGDGRVGGIYKAEPFSDRSSDYKKGEPDNGDQLDDGISYQQRTEALTNREILELASDEVKIDGLTDGQKEALSIFKKHLLKLQDLQEKRAELGIQYKEQQFGEHVDRAAAAETLNRMHILDDQIRNQNDELFSIEEKAVLREILVKARKVVEQTEREHGKEILKRWRDRRNNAAAIKKYRERLRKDVDELSKWVIHPNNKDVVKHIPDALKDSVIPFLSSINFMSKQSLKGGNATAADKEFIKRLNGLKAALKPNQNLDDMYNAYTDLPPNFMDRLDTFITSAQALVENNSGEFIINQMTAEELKKLSLVVRNLKEYIKNFNKFHVNAMFRHVYEAGDDTIQSLSQMKSAGSHTGNISNFVLWQQMRPAYAFERFGDGGRAIYDGLRRGQSTLAFNTKKIQEFAKKAYNEREVKAWEKEIKTILLSEGVAVKMRVSQIMSFYELSKRPQALGHILGGGIRVATYNNKGKKISDAGHTLTKTDVEVIISKLTVRQMEVADNLQNFMQEQGGKWGNYVSLKRFGEELFGEEHYFPINSDGRHLSANADEHPAAASLYALLNMGFTKSLQEGANNRIVIYSIFDVFANHMASMAQYNAFALPVVDAIKWFNYQQKGEPDENGMRGVLGSVRDQMDRVYGVPEETRPGSGRQGYAQSFVINILKAFNGTEAQGVPTDTTGMNALRRYNMAQVAFNFRVVVQQPMAVTRAALLIDYSSIIKGMKLRPAAIQNNITEMQKYSGIAAWKSLGFYDVNISRGLSEVIKHQSNALDKISDVGMWGAEKADLLTWAAIWSACKEEVIKKQKLTPKSKDFYETVTKLFEDVIYKTQVVDSVLTKNEYLRSKGFVARAIGSFMSEPTTTASMLVDAYEKFDADMRRGMSRQQAWRKNGKKIARTACVYAISALILAAVQAVADAFRDDDDYQTFLEKWLEAFSGNAIDELIPINKLPIMSDIYDTVKALLSVFGVDTYGNPPQTVIMQWYDSLIKGAEIVYDKVTCADTNYTWYGGIYKLLQAVSGMSGLPMGTTTRELITAWNNTIGYMAPSLKVKTYDAGDKVEIKYAYLDGYLTDEEAAENLVKQGIVDNEDDARFMVRGWKENISAAAAEKYMTYCETAGVPLEIFNEAWQYNSDTEADIDKDGNAISGSKKEKVLDYINSFNLTSRQKDSLYYAFGWAESKINEAPWH